ncbi:Mobile element protein [Kitasatospora purpeofusca]
MWAKLHRVALDELGARRAGLLEVRGRLGEHEAAEQGELTGPNPVDRGKYGSKIHLLAERAGRPRSPALPARPTRRHLPAHQDVEGVHRPRLRHQARPDRARPGPLP